MVNLSSINDNVLILFNKILENQDLLKAIGNTDKDFLNQPVPDVESLLYKNITPFRFIDEAVENNDTYLNFIFRGFTRHSDRFMNGLIEFHIFVHKDNVVTKNGLRHYLISNYIDSIFNGLQIKSLGLLEFDSLDEYPSPFRTEYVYQVIRYEITFFN